MNIQTAPLIKRSTVSKSSSSVQLPPQPSRWHNLRNPNYQRWLIRAGLYEFLGSLVLIFIQIASGEALFRNGTGFIASDVLGHGFGAFVAVFMVAHVSGAVLNPAMTLGFWFIRRLDAMSVLVYTVAQVAGSFAAAGLYQAAFGSITKGVGVPLLADSMTTLRGILAESILGFFLFFLSAMVVLRGRWFWYKNGYHFHNPGPISVTQTALVVTAWMIATEAAFVSLIGSSPNPIRWLGPAVIGGNLEHWSVWIIGPYIGVLAAVPFYLFDAAVLRPERRQLVHKMKNTTDDQINHHLNNPTETMPPPPPYNIFGANEKVPERQSTLYIMKPLSGMPPPRRRISTTRSPKFQCDIPAVTEIVQSWMHQRNKGVSPTRWSRSQKNT